jgi:PAS domain S-box-containing protein
VSMLAMGSLLETADAGVKPAGESQDLDFSRSKTRVEDRLRDVLEAIPAAIYTTDAAGRITFYNQAAAELAGRRPVIGRDERCVTWRLYNPDGTPMPHDHCPMATASRENRAMRGATAVAERPDGTLRNGSGALVGAVNMLVDITQQQATEAALRASEERYRELNETLELRIAERTRELVETNRRLRSEIAERNHAEATLREAQKMEAVGQLASGIAHDFNNVLTTILGNLELIEPRLSDPKLRSMVASAAKAALRGAQLNNQVLAFSRKQHLAPRPVELGALTDDMMGLLRSTLGGAIDIETELAPDLWSVLVDPIQVELVLLNLVFNARDAMPSGGVMRIGACNVKASDVRKDLGLAPGDYVCVSVADNGMGMTEAVLLRACEPFFTTKPPGQGSGLGLSQAYGVARQSGGDISIASEVGKGTTVELYLPRSHAKAEAGNRYLAADKRGVARPQTTILIVDDQDDVRDVAANQLDVLGYRVLQARDAKTALNAIETEKTIDLLIADYTMANMNGIELAQAAQQARHELPIIIMTGYLGVRAIGDLLPDALLLRKPYRVNELAAVVEQAASVVS